MDLLKFQASLDAHTAALNTHSAAIAQLIGAGAGAPTSPGEATPAKPSRGRPTDAERAAKAAAATAAQTSTAAATGATPSGTGTTPAQPAANQTGVAPATVNGPLTHLALKDKFLAFGKSKGRDAVVNLLKEFGVTEFGKVPAESLPLFRDRLDGKPQTPVPGDDMDNLLGL